MLTRLQLNSRIKAYFHGGSVGLYPFHQRSVYICSPGGVTGAPVYADGRVYFRIEKSTMTMNLDNGWDVHQR